VPNRSRNHPPAAARSLVPDIERGLVELGLPAAPAATLDAYLTELGKWNASYNLTAVRDPAEMVIRHLFDSLGIVAYVDALLADSGCEPRLLDVGAGAGLPGIPVAIVRPGWQITLLDSNGKKARFLRHVQRTLALGKVEVIEGRVEACDPTRPFPLIVSRAFASLADFVKLSGNLLAPDGRWLAMKGKVSPEELGALPADVRVEAVHELNIPGLREARSLIVVRRA
jgi:16S rRNA (guanine527-N7)-methyltransferase